MIRYFEAFAGLGAFRSAFEKVGGFECVGWCEIDRYAQKAYRALYDTGGEKFYEDITKIDYGGIIFLKIALCVFQLNNKAMKKM